MGTIVFKLKISYNFPINQSSSMQGNMSGGGDGQQKKPDLGLLEEDDEFEEFPSEDWAGDEEDKGDENVWEDNWDDDNIEDDFSRQLRAELEKQGQKCSAESL